MRSSRVGNLLLGLLFFPASGGIGLRAADPAPTAAIWQKLQVQSARALDTMSRQPGAAEPLPTGVTDLSFAEFFEPIGDRGLEYSARLRALEGKRVRLSGFMVREQQRTAGIFLLAPFATSVETQGFCYIDHVPPTGVHVLLPPEFAEALPPFRPGRQQLIGTLELGPRAEADGRNSAVRLRLDPAANPLFFP